MSGSNSNLNSDVGKATRPHILKPFKPESVLADPENFSHKLTEALKLQTPVEEIKKLFDLLFDSKDQLISQVDIYNTLVSLLDTTSISTKYLFSVSLELMTSIRIRSIEVDEFIEEFVVLLAIRSKSTFARNILDCVKDSGRIAKMLLMTANSETTPVETRELFFSFGIDMLYRLEKYDQIVQMLLSRKLVLQSVLFIRERGLLKFMEPKKFLEAVFGTPPDNKIVDNVDKVMFYNIYRFMEQRNLFLYSSSQFKKSDDVAIYEEKFREYFHNKPR